MPNLTVILSRADGRALRKKNSEVVGEGEGGVHWRNIRSFDWKGWSKCVYQPVVFKSKMNKYRIIAHQLETHHI